MKVIESSFFNEALRFIEYGSRFGWHERNAGNLSLMLNSMEVDSVKDDFLFRADWISLPEAVADIAGEYVFTTLSGSYFIDMEIECESKFCICEISSDGDSYRIVWGGDKPTSELFGHLISLCELKKRNGGRAVYHCHPANIIALSYILPQNDMSVSNAVWESETECAFVIPNGIGVLGFYIPGSIELAKATALKIADYDAVLWSFHGIFATGGNISSAFALAHVIEKAAEIKLKVLSSGQPIMKTISIDEQKQSAEYYGYTLNDFKC